MINNFLSLANQNPDDNVQVRKIYNLVYGDYSQQLVIGVDSITNQVGLMQISDSEFDVAEPLEQIEYYEIMQPFNVKETSFTMSDEIEVDITHQQERVLYEIDYKGHIMKQSILYFYLPEIDFYAICKSVKGVTSRIEGDEGEEKVEVFSDYEEFYLTSLVERINWNIIDNQI